MAAVPTWLTTAEAAERLGVPLPTVYREVRELRLPAIRVGRILRIEGVAFGARPAQDDLPTPLTLYTLAQWLRIHPHTLYRIIWHGRGLTALPRIRHRHAYLIPRSAALHFLLDRFSGPDDDVVLGPAGDLQ